MIGAAGACLAGLPANVSQMRACTVSAALSCIAPLFLYMFYISDVSGQLLECAHFLFAWLERFAAGAAIVVGIGLFMPIGRQLHPSLALQFGMFGFIFTLLLSGLSRTSSAVLASSTAS